MNPWVEILKNIVLFHQVIISFALVNLFLDIPRLTGAGCSKRSITIQSNEIKDFLPKYINETKRGFINLNLWNSMVKSVIIEEQKKTNMAAGRIVIPKGKFVKDYAIFIFSSNSLECSVWIAAITDSAVGDAQQIRNSRFIASSP